jgi:hypothetical protein
MDINSKYCGLLLTVHLFIIKMKNFFLKSFNIIYSIQTWFQFINKVLPEEGL